MPFEIPESWVWTTLGTIGRWQSGATPSRMRKDYYGGGIPWLKTGDLNDGFITDIPETITPLALSETSVKLNPAGSILIAMYGATIGKIGILTKPATTNQACCACVSHNGVEQMYLFYFLLSYKEEFIRQGGGGAQPNISKEKIIETYIPLPPLCEQNRIVNEVVKWNKMIDNIESEKSDLLAIVSQIKSKILDFAISGKLIQQDPNDEPAIELLKRINSSFEPCDNSHYENLPDGWCVCLLKDIFEIIMGQSPDGDTVNNENGVEFHQGKICFTNEYLLPSGVYTSKPTKIAEVNSLLLCVRAPVGILNITKREICIGRGLCSLKPKYEIDNKYWFYILSAYKDYFEQNATGSTFKAISGDTIKNTEILLPPINEQIRITKAISSLWNILDTITAELQ